MSVEDYFSTGPPHERPVPARHPARRPAHRPLGPTGTRTWYVVNLRTSDDVDDRVRSWLTEAYLSTPD